MVRMRGPSETKQMKESDLRRREYHWSLFHSTEKNQIDGLRTDQVEAVFAAIPKNQKKEWFIWKEGFDAWKPFEDFPQLVLSLRKADDRVFEQPPPFPGANETVAGTMAGTSVGTSVGTMSAIDLAPPSQPSQSQSSQQTQQPAAARPVEVQPKTTPPKESVRAVKSSNHNQAIPGQKLVLDADQVGEGEDDLSLMRSGVLEDRNNMRFDKVLEVRIFIGDEVFKNSTSNISLKGMQLREALPKSLPRYFNVEIGKGDRTIPVVCSEVKSKEGPSMRLKIESNEHASALLTMLLSGSNLT
jgi:hypothetical protein